MRPKHGMLPKAYKRKRTLETCYCSKFDGLLPRPEIKTRNYSLQEESTNSIKVFSEHSDNGHTESSWLYRSNEYSLLFNVLCVAAWVMTS